MYGARLKFNQTSYPIVNGNITYKNNFQYDIEVEIPKIAIDFTENNQATIEIYDTQTNTTIKTYPFHIRKVTGDDIYKISGSDFTQNIDIYYYHWLDILENMKSTTIHTNEEGKVNITRYVFDSIVNPIFSSLTTTPLTFIDEYIDVNIEQLKQFVFGLIDDFMRNPTLSGLLSFLKRFGVTLIYDGERYTVVGAYTLWQRYTNAQPFQSYLRVGNYEADLSHLYDKVIVKNIAYITKGEKDSEWIAEYPNDTTTNSKKDLRVKVVTLNIPYVNKTLLSRIAAMIWLDEHARMFTTTYALQDDMQIDYYTGVRININQGVVYWLVRRIASPEWWEETGEDWLFKKYDAQLVVGSNLYAQQTSSPSIVTKHSEMSIGSYVYAKPLQEAVSFITKNATLEIGSYLFGFVFFSPVYWD